MKIIQLIAILITVIGIIGIFLSLKSEKENEKLIYIELAALSIGVIIFCASIRLQEQEERKEYLSKIEKIQKNGYVKKDTIDNGIFNKNIILYTAQSNELNFLVEDLQLLLNHSQLLFLWLFYVR